MKILFIHNDYAKYSGEEHAIESIASLLAEHGHEIVWYRRSSLEISGSRLGQAKAFVAALHNPSAIKDVVLLVEKENPDLAFVQNLYPLISPSVLRILHRQKVPIVMRCPNYRLLCPNGLLFSHGEVCEKCLGHGREFWCVMRNCENSIPKSIGYALRHAVARLRRIIRSSVDVFIVLSQFQRKYFIRNGLPEECLSVVPNMVPVSVNDDIEPGGGSVIGFVGRIAQEKGFCDFIEAARQLPQLKFEAAGSIKDGYDIGDLPENIVMRGFLSGEVFEKFIADMQMLVSSSGCFEGFPNTITQAMAAGRPVIATTGGVAPEIVDDGVTGLLYAPGDVGLLVQHVRQLVGDVDMRRSMGEAGREKALRCYSHDTVYKTLMVAFEKARKDAGCRLSGSRS